MWEALFEGGGWGDEGGREGGGIFIDGREGKDASKAE